MVAPFTERDERDMKAGTILMYQCSGSEYSKLRQIFAMLRLRMRPVEPDRYHLTLAELSQGQGELAAQQAPEQIVQEPMLVFCELSEALLAQVLEVIRLAKLPPIALKAVLTQDNRDWTTAQLYQELLRERESIAAGQQAES